MRTQPWYVHYAANDLDSARLLLKERLKEHEDELPTLLYYAETLRRLKKHAAADSVADKALSLDPNSGFALRIKGGLRDAQFTGTDSVSGRDSSVYYYRKAIEVDPDDCVTWELLWIAAMEEGDSAGERSALRHLHSCGIYTQTAYAYARWLLGLLPDSAVLITNGDMDTYPLRVLQVAERFRPDVAVVNVSLLNLESYYRYVCRYHGIPMAFADDELGEIEHRLNDGEVETIAEQFVSGWIDLASRGQLDRPLCAAITVSRRLLPEELTQRLSLKGPYYLLADTLDMYGDPETLEAAVRFVDVDKLSGPFISDKIVSPLLLNVKNKRPLDANFVATALYAALGYQKAQRPDKAVEMLDWAEAYLEAVGNEHSEMADKLQLMRTRIVGDAQ
ncbi:MAG: hypothetical protein GF331_15195 [Chitinivibrionales bacterium]|nr:hypothetical protein [Chitinivibrionales bacterium]